jgi:hypothetical protein
MRVVVYGPAPSAVSSARQGLGPGLMTPDELLLSLDGSATE